MATTRASFNTLPVEILERIISKCDENDAELLEGQTSLFQRMYGSRSGEASQDRADEEENAWETDDGDDESQQSSSPSSMSVAGPSKQGGRKIKSHNSDGVPWCKDCGEYHGVGDWLFGHAEGKEILRVPPVPTLAIPQLAMTSKLLRSLTLPLVYENLDFEDRPNRILSRWLNVIGPKYGHFVRRLWLRVSLAENREFAEIEDGQEEDPEEFREEERYELAMQVLAKVPNLIEIDIDLPKSSRYGRKQLDADSIEGNLCSRPDTLLSLCLTHDSIEGPLSTEVVGEIVLKLPKLERVELMGVGYQSIEGPNLRDVLAKLEHLGALQLNYVDCFDNSWAEADWKSQLKVIRLEDCQSAEAIGVEKLLQRHAKSLHVIGLLMTPDEQDVDELNDGPPYDFPELTDLVLESQELKASFLQRFSLCPKLESIELGEMDRFQVKDLIDLIDRNKSGENAGFPALSEFVLATDAWPESDEDPAMENLELLCFEHRIEIVRKEPEEDSDDDDEDDMYSDDEMMDDLSGIEGEDDEDGDGHMWEEDWDDENPDDSDDDGDQDSDV